MKANLALFLMLLTCPVLFYGQSSYTVSGVITEATGEGTFYLRARTFDNAGNYTAPTTVFTFRYDETAPTNPIAPASAWDSSVPVDTTIKLLAIVSVLLWLTAIIAGRLTAYL